MMRMQRILAMGLALVLVAAIAGACTSQGGGKQGAPIRIGRIDTFTGVLEAYAVEAQRGFELGLQHATNGTNQVNGRPIELFREDTETNPQVAKQKALKLLDEQKVDILIGSTSSADTLAIMPLMTEFKRPLVVASAIADSITAEDWNRYVFRTARSNSMDAVTWAAALGQKDATIAILGEDYAMGRQGIQAFKQKVAPAGARIVYEQYAPSATTDFTPYIQGMAAAKPDYAITYWAGANSPWAQMVDHLPKAGIQLSLGVLDLAHLKAYKGQTGHIENAFAIYYYDIPKNPINDWFVKEYQAKYGSPPSYSTATGFIAATAVVEALKKTGGETDPEKLIGAMEGMAFESVKGKMTIRKEDHQALQEMYVVELQDQPGVDWVVPVVKRVLSMEETAPPIRTTK